MQRESDSCSQDRQRRRRWNKDSFWAFVFLATWVVVPVMYGYSAYMDTQVTQLSGGISDEAGAMALVQTAALVVGALF